jgi:predicted pyridoxine 5'-phosphate oxidase superfamily flavin-nucleotide-binding protein
MGKVYDTIDDKLGEFIGAQQMFFVATAPRAEDGHVNVSPKGLDSFLILDELTVAYADLAGSGIETVAHLRENGRIVIMFCALEGAPKIVRLHGRGEVIDPAHADFPDLRDRFPPYTGLRTFIRVTCDRISDSCGWGVPLYNYAGQRSQLLDWADKKGIDDIKAYQQQMNLHSVDGIPGIEIDREST